MNPTYNIEGLQPYIKQNRDELITRFMLKGKTIDRIAIRTDIKTSEAIHFGDIDVTFRNGRGCGFEPGTGMVLTDRILTTAILEVDKEFCADDLLNSYAEALVKIGVGQAELPFESYITELIVNKIAEKLEKLIWQGDTDLVDDDDLKWIDGFLKMASDETSTINVSVPAGSSYYELVKAVYMAMPEEVLAQASAAIHVQPSIYRALRQELLEKNYFHHSVEDAEPEEFNWPGSDVKVVRTLGLAGSGVVYASFDRNMVYGCDKESDKRDLKVGYEEKTDKFWVKARFNAGVQTYFPDWVVIGSIGAAPTPGETVNRMDLFYDNGEELAPVTSQTVVPAPDSGSPVYIPVVTDPADAEVVWTSSNPAIATVEAGEQEGVRVGVITGVADGLAIITAKAGNLSQSFIVMVEHIS